MSAPSSSVETYYRFHARIYDATRWSFLFGRKEIVADAAAAVEGSTPGRVLEVGCGTGFNLRRLRRALPDAVLVGVDLSADMLRVASSHLSADVADGSVDLRRGRFPEDLMRGGDEETFDLVLFSYSLSMFNPGWEEAIDGAASVLRPRGRVAAVDFHDSSFPGFERWMSLNHVRLDAHLLPRFRERFVELSAEVRPVPSFAPIWRYFTFVGQTRS